ncbi:MAG TPA: thymidylate synthase (FAD) [Sulfurovum sp. UBA12169]|nr:MAG TPA: thymidylate synthase (FAD) [Sulfurovum sp. UBA12169]
MQITLLHHTPLNICAHAIRTCWQSFDNSDEGGEKDKALIDRVGNKFKHASTLEHLVYTFYIEGISRALLQELARHRMASLSVKSTRYTLKELKECEPFGEQEYGKASKFIVLTGNKEVDAASIKALKNLQVILKSGTSNDIAKYCLPESYKTELTWTANARSLQNFLTLRSNKSALWEIRELALAIYEKLPNEHQYLFEECMYKEK